MKHSEIIELLPWYAKATLPEDERKMVETHLADCGECAREVQSLAILQKTIVEIGDKVPTPSPMALNRAMAEIENYERTRSQATAQVSQPSLFERLSMWWSPTPIFARAIIAVQLVLVLGFGGVIIYEHTQSATYTTASGPSGDRTATQISVSFSGSATEQEIRQAVLAVHGKIIDGPSALGLYTIQVPVAPDRTTEIDGVLKTLRENQHVVQFAEQKQ
jgi:anti-sigma factor RsiW